MSTLHLHYQDQEVVRHSKSFIAMLAKALQVIKANLYLD